MLLGITAGTARGPGAGGVERSRDGAPTTHRATAATAGSPAAGTAGDGCTAPSLPVPLGTDPQLAGPQLSSQRAAALFPGQPPSITAAAIRCGWEGSGAASPSGCGFKRTQTGSYRPGSAGSPGGWAALPALPEARAGLREGESRAWFGEGEQRLTAQCHRRRAGTLVLGLPVPNAEAGTATQLPPSCHPAVTQLVRRLPAEREVKARTTPARSVPVPGHSSHPGAGGTRGGGLRESRGSARRGAALPASPQLGVLMLLSLGWFFGSLRLPQRFGSTPRSVGLEQAAWAAPAPCPPPGRFLCPFSFWRNTEVEGAGGGAEIRVSEAAQLSRRSAGATDLVPAAERTGRRARAGLGHRGTLCSGGMCHLWTCPHQPEPFRRRGHPKGAGPRHGWADRKAQGYYYFF